MIEIILWIILISIIAIAVYFVIYWIRTYNNFQLLIQTINQRFSDIGVVMQKRVDMMMAIVHVAERYNIHENTTLEETTEARSRFGDPNRTVTERLGDYKQMEDNFMKIQAVVENYPDLKAELIQSQVLQNDVYIEQELSQVRSLYNEDVKNYNYQISIFPQSIIAKIHHLKEYGFITFENQQPYDVEEIYHQEPENK